MLSFVSFVAVPSSGLQFSYPKTNQKSWRRPEPCIREEGERKFYIFDQVLTSFSIKLYAYISYLRAVRSHLGIRVPAGVRTVGEGGGAAALLPPPPSLVSEIFGSFRVKRR